MIDEWSRIVQSLLLDPVCVLCGGRGEDGLDLCRACRHDLPGNVGACARCALPLRGGLGADALCGRCQTQPPIFERCLAPFAYQAPLDFLLRGLKFHGRLSLARTLGELMARWLQTHADALPERVLPVPLHPARLRSRGFNQSLELARYIARRLDLPLDGRSCVRRRDTPPQAELRAEERRSNVKGAFEVVGALSGSVAIVDDVLTTGSTAQELARVLYGAGASRVEVWVCARAGF